MITIALVTGLTLERVTSHGVSRKPKLEELLWLENDDDMDELELDSLDTDDELLDSLEREDDDKLDSLEIDDELLWLEEDDDIEELELEMLKDDKLDSLDREDVDENARTEESDDLLSLNDDDEDDELTELLDDEEMDDCDDCEDEDWLDDDDVANSVSDTKVRPADIVPSAVMSSANNLIVPPLVGSFPVPSDVIVAPFPSYDGVHIRMPPPAPLSPADPKADPEPPSDEPGTL